MKTLLKYFFILSILSSYHFANEIKAIDFLGKEVSINHKPQKAAITCYGGAIQEIAIFLDSDSVIAHPGSERFPFFRKLFPKLASKESIGTFNDVNLETVLKVSPDIIFAGSTSIDTNDKIEKLGIPIYTMGIGKHSLKSLLVEFENMGKIFSKIEKAQELILYWEEKLEEIKQKTKKIRNRQKVFYSTGSNEITTENRDWWGDIFISKSGGINVAKEMKTKGVVSIEKVILWNPSVIVLPSNRALKITAKDFLNNPQFKSIDAVKNKEIHIAPVAGFWWDRPSPEAILGIMWLSKILYPNEMKDLDLKKESKLFYKKFYNYKLTNVEYKSFSSNYINHTK